MSGRPAPDPLHKATLAFKQHGVGIELHALEGVFAGAGVDAGTRHLLRWLAADRYAGAARILDLGCGYGPLGLWLAAADPGRSVLAVDRDARALEATRRGAAANAVADRVELRGSLGYDEVGDGGFDLVTSNIPAKVGPAALRHLVLDAAHHLRPGGTVALVVVDRLAGPVGDLLADDAVEVLDIRPSRAYTAYEYRFRRLPAGSSSTPGFDLGVYRRGRQAFRAGRRSWEADVAWSLPEFDALGHGTLAALGVLPAVAGGATVAVVGVGQGHLPLALRAGGHTGPVRLVDRDLLALRVAAANLGAPERVELRHGPAPAAADLAGADLVLAGLPEREPVAVTAAVLGPALARAGDALVVLHGRVADVHRVLELLPRHGATLLERRRHRHRGHAAVLLARGPAPNSVTTPR